ncbi:MAG: polysaccharide pyruvyl transferase family protein [Cycloclasticus sp.]|nr:polysaccharide pyruvyl transferase family protein [Cycloclasticus sp.]
MKVAVIGYYGENFGDLLMLSVLIERAKLSVNNFQIYTYGDSEDLRLFLNQLSVGAMRVDVIGLKQAGLLGFLSNIRGAKFIAWGGGTCFMDEGGTGGIKYMVLAKFLRVPVFYIGVGIDAHKKYLTRMCISMAMLFSRQAYFRDEESRKIASSYFFGKRKALFVPDLAFSMSQDLNSKNVSVFDGNPYIAICPRELALYFGGDASEVNLQLCELVRAIAGVIKTNRVVIIAADLIEDSLSCYEIARMLGEQGFVTSSVEGCRVNETISLIAKASFLVSVRLHPAVVSHLCNTPYVLFGYSAKNAKYLNYVNSPQRLISFGDVDLNASWFECPEECFSVEFSRTEVLRVLDSIFVCESD